MKRRQILTGILGAMGLQMLTALPALAQTFVEQIVTQLREQGFESIEVERTLLGRTRIAALRSDGSREIVLNPNTGEILRDLWTSTSGRNSGRINIGSAAGEDDNSGPGGDDDNDSSGPGSGGGSGGSGGDGDDGGDEGADDDDDGD